MTRARETASIPQEAHGVVVPAGSVKARRLRPTVNRHS